jgi:sugar phosphate isomerase/epimerase
VEVYLKHLEPCLKRATQLGVTIVLENEFNAFGVDPAKSDITRRPRSLLKLVETAASPHFRLNFDACNFYCAGVEPYPYAYEMLKGYIAYVHVKDGSVYDPDSHQSATLWRRYRDYEQEYIMRPMGEGAVNWAALLARLSAEGYSGFLTLEPHSAKSEMGSAWAQAIGYVNAFLHRGEEEDRHGN